MKFNVLYAKKFNCVSEVAFSIYIQIPKSGQMFIIKEVPLLKNVLYDLLVLMNLVVVLFQTPIRWEDLLAEVGLHLISRSE